MPPPSLPDDLIEEVLLRVSADDPRSLVRAALACRRWCRLVADPAFHRRRVQLHGATAPMLGFLCEHDCQPLTRFVPMSSCFPPRADHRGLRALDARHGRVLLQDSLSRDSFVVWDPVADQRAVLPRPPWCSSLEISGVKATVLCAATGTGTCDHLDCRRGHFIVVLVGTIDTRLDFDDDQFFLDDDDDEDDDDFMDYDDGDFLDDDDDDDDDVSDDYDFDGNGMVPGAKMFTCTYSSESGSWSDPTYASGPCDWGPGGQTALVGNTLFLKLCSYHRILKYDLCMQETSVVRLPRVRLDMIPLPTALAIQIELTTLEDGRRLGFVRMEESNRLCLWSRDDEGDDQVAGWTLRRAIDLNKLFPLVDSLDAKHRRLAGVVEGVCVAFVSVQKHGLFTIDMRTGLMNKVSEDFGTACCVVPYIDFCTQALRAPSRDDEPVEETLPGNPR